MGINHDEKNSKSGQVPRLLIITGLLLFVNLTFAQLIIDGDVNLFSQVEVDNYGDYSSINGDLTINGTGIVNLHNLTSLNIINGNLTIESTSCSNLKGLDNLIHVGGNLLISNNNNLTSLSGIEKLRSVGGFENINYLSFLDERDGRIYKSVRIDTFEVMAENLSYLPVVYPLNIYGNTPHFYVYDYNGFSIDEAQNDNYNKYGVIYNYPAAMKVCPSGWHLPKKDEWLKVAEFISNENGGYTYTGSEWEGVGGHLKTIDGWTINHGTDDYGFSGLPGGHFDYNNKETIDEGQHGEWWTSNSSASVTRLRFADTKMYFLSSNTYGNGHSVRCFKGNPFDTLTPGVITNPITEKSESSALIGGNVFSDGGKPILSAGICYKRGEIPTIADNNFNSIPELGTFSNNITGLLPYRRYFVRAYATNDVGISWGANMSFRTEDSSIPITIDYGSFTDSRDGNEYKTIQIGNQTWMAENLAYLPSVNPYNCNDFSETLEYYYVLGYQGSSTSEAKLLDYYDSLGVLYNYPAALESCPANWHLPTEAEWEELASYISSENGGYNWTYSDFNNKNWSDVGFHLKSKTGWPDDSGGLNDTGFSALPGGGNCDDSINSLRWEGWWVYSDREYDFKPVRYLTSSNDIFGYGVDTPEYPQNVRCIHD
jgi:uncharacterized protein (TIGR02145 family)